MCVEISGSDPASTGDVLCSQLHVPSLVCSSRPIFNWLTSLRFQSLYIPVVLSFFFITLIVGCLCRWRGRRQALRWAQEFNHGLQDPQPKFELMEKPIIYGVAISRSWNSLGGENLRAVIQNATIVRGFVDITNMNLNDLWVFLLGSRYPSFAQFSW